MVTTIQISENLRDELKSFKSSSNSSYDDVISKLVKKYKEEKIQKIDLLKESYLEMAKITTEENNFWEKIDLDDLKKNDY